MTTRVRELRLERGLEPEAIAQRVGLTMPEYFDLESYPDEVETTLAIVQVMLLARVLGVTLRDLLPNSMGQGNHYTLDDLPEVFGRHLRERGWDIEALTHMSGWEVPGLEREVEVVLKLNIYGLSCVCEALGIDFGDVLKALDDYAASRAEEELRERVGQLCGDGE